jgi:hypothetical protein
VWLDLTLTSTSATLYSAPTGSGGRTPESEETAVAAQRLFDRIFDAEPLLAT